MLDPGSLSFSTSELETRSWLYSRILKTVIVLQLLVGLVAWFAFRSIRQFDARVLEHHAALMHYHERLDRLSDEIHAMRAQGRRPGAALELADSLKFMGQEGAALPAETLAAAAGEAELFRSLGDDVSRADELSTSLDDLEQKLGRWRSAGDKADDTFQLQVTENKRSYVLLKWVVGIRPVFVLTSLLCVAMLERETRKQRLRREGVEEELRRERSTLEKRIELRTVELQSEVKERRRAEQLNRGRNQLLEMIAREEPTREIFGALVSVAAGYRSRWCCVLHLMVEGELRMEASSGLPHSLLRNLQQLAVDMQDAPEALALRERKPQVLQDVAQERKPWPQLLYANGIQSMWATPILAPDRTPLGTLTIYSLLRATPSEADLNLLESHTQMASMVLERYRLQKELRRHAYHDSLTGIPNRLLGEQQLADAITRSRIRKTSTAVLWIDLDKFKQTNDVHGHVAGDAVLQEVAARLQKRFNGMDGIARMGGDEFMAVIEDANDREAMARAAEELVKDLGRPVAFQGLMLNTAASVGISIFPEDGDSADLLQRKADMAMYEAKFGQHGVRAYSPERESVLSERRELEAAMLHALEHDGFQLHYQPQFRRSGRLGGFEALLRFTHPTLGMVAPSRLIPIAEESQMIVSLGNWVLREACRQGRRWQQAGYDPVSIAVNISAMQFARDDFAMQVSEALAEAGLDPALLQLELTESVMVKDFDESARQLKRLKTLGVSIALDDFGTGYSSLNQLHRLPIDILKIDRSFVQAVNDSGGTGPMVEGIVSLAHRMKMRVVGEGVETAEQMEALCGIDCDLLQGYLFSRPVDAEQAEALLAVGESKTLVRRHLFGWERSKEVGLSKAS